MTKSTYIMLAPIRLKNGVGEAALVAASDRFQTTFLSRQQGITRRLLLKSREGSYADLVFFASKDDADRVVAAEASSEECLEYFEVMEAPDPSLPEMGVLSFQHVKTYE
jgi:hypothetical protein